MRTPAPSSDFPFRWLRGILYSLVFCTTLVIVLNTNESGIAKHPLLVLHASLLVIVACMAALRQRRIPFTVSSGAVPVLVFCASILLATMLNPDRWQAARALEFWLSCGVCFYAAASLFRQRVHSEQFIRVLALVSLAVCAVALVQLLLPQHIVFDVRGGKEQRVSSTLGNATFLGSFVVLLFPVMLAAAFSQDRSRNSRIAFGLLSAALAALLFAGATRSSIAGFVVSLVLFFFVLGSKQKRAVLATTVALALLFAAATYVSPTLGKRMLTAFEMDRTSSFARRLYFWEAGYKAFRDAPIMGHGLGRCENVIMQFRSPDYWTVGSEDIVAHAHNELIELAVETGAVGLLAYLVVVAVVVRAAFRQMRAAQGAERLLHLGFLCGFVAILTDNLAGISLRVAPIGPLAWMWMGILAAPRERTEMSSVKQISGVGKEALLLAAWFACAVWYGLKEWDHVQADRHFLRGLMAKQKNDHSTSVAEYTAALTLAPHNLAARANAAHAYLATGRYSEALAVSREVQTLSPFYPKANLLQAVALLSLGRNREALDAALREASLRNHPDAYAMEAVARKSLGDTMNERKALLQLFDAVVRGRVPYNLQHAAARSLQLARSDEERKELLTTFEQLRVLFPDNPVVRQTVAALSRPADGERRTPALPPPR
jgi:O-antigen ligase